jgi:putative RNA 2'-phosphotransferase
MDDARVVKLSRYLSKHLRHRPERLGLTLEPGGWVRVEDLLRATSITREELEEVVARNDKQRFSFDATGEQIRANQGHSLEVDLQLEPADPPPVLFHGTNQRAVEAIRRDGLLPQGRHHVHLSPDEATATRVGARRGRPVVLTIDAAAMAAAGRRFYVSDNGVWLTDAVPPRFIR